MRHFFNRARDSFVLQTAYDLLLGALFAVILVLIYAVVQLNDDNTELRHREAVQTALACPPRLTENLIFTHSGFTKMDLARPGSVRLSCYYARGRKG